MLNIISNYKITREFKSYKPMDEAILEINRMMTHGQHGLNRAEGILGTANKSIVKLGYLYPNIGNAWHSVFVGRFSEEGSCTVLSGFYRKTYLIYFFHAFICIFSAVFVFSSIADLIMADQVNTLKEVIMWGGFAIYLALISLIIRIAMRLSRKDEIKIDDALEKALACKVRIIE